MKCSKKSKCAQVEQILLRMEKIHKYITLIIYNIDHIIKQVKFDSSIEIRAQYLIDYLNT